MDSAVQKMNSMLPEVLSGSPKANNGSPKANNGSPKANNSGSNNSGSPKANNQKSDAFNMSKMLSMSSMPSMNSATATDMNTPMVWFVAVLIIFMAILGYYYNEVNTSLQNMSDSFNTWMQNLLGGSNKEVPELSRKSNTPVSSKPPAPKAPQDETKVESAVERILPPAKEIFNVSKNDYTYYDAAPLCKSLGAELATYDEVKNAWNKGADWCNYGWVKGQMAVYPTQKSTYEELQLGPEEQKGACGKPGVNGGHFDNPEMRFGVTCSGRRPPQKNHDATSVISGPKLPLTASGLEFEKQVQRFKADSDSIGIMPFNKEKWSS